MLRKLLIIIAALSLLFLLGCQSQHDVSNALPKDESPKPTATTELPKPTATTVETSFFKDSNKAINVPIDSVEGQGISEEEAAKLCVTVFGEKNEKTGFKYGYRRVGAVEFKGKYYYVMFRTWLVDDNHWSNIGYAMVSVNGDAVYDGVIDDAGNYYFVFQR